MKIIKNRDMLVGLLPKNMVGAELGVFRGDFSMVLLTTIAPKLLYMVDLFEGIMGSGDKNGLNMQFVNLGPVYELWKSFAAKRNDIRLFKGTTKDFLETLENDSLDFVYIDAEHTYESVKEDLRLSRDKVKPDGYVMGHDYSIDIFPGVVQAVNEFCQAYNLAIDSVTEDGSPSFLIINKK